MIAAFTHPVRVARNNQQRNSAKDEREGIENSSQKAAESFEILHRAWEPEQESHLPADKAEINGSQQENTWAQQSTQVGNSFAPLELGVFPAQGFHQSDALAFRQPSRLCRMVLNKFQPNCKPQER